MFQLLPTFFQSQIRTLPGFESNPTKTKVQILPLFRVAVLKLETGATLKSDLEGKGMVQSESGLSRQVFLSIT
jgi:hypothetical protein